MKIQINSQAAAWYKQELNLKGGDYVRFFARYGGCSNVQSGFSLGVSKEVETHGNIFSTTVEGITFYIDEKDLWYFDGHDFIVEYNSAIGEPEFKYVK